MNKRSQLIVIIIVLCLLVFGVGVLLLDRKGYINIFADTVDSNVSSNINQNFSIKKSQLATIDSEKLVAYISEIKDNRCPLQVICFWPGTVDIKLNLVKNGRVLSTLDFSSYTDLEMKPDIAIASTRFKNVGNYKIFLTGVGQQTQNNDSGNLNATFYISLFNQGVAKSMIFKTGLPSMNGKVLTAYQDGNVYIDDFNVKANSIDGTQPYQYITTSQSEKLYFKPNKYLSQKKEYSFKDTDNITFEFMNLLIGDLNKDDTINSLDWSLLNGFWQQNNSSFDLTGDSVINSLDWSLMNINWNKQGDGLKEGWQMYLDNKG
ncbi:MAG: hypothetical protein ACD_58C00131G0018 [uncultured bacterium]|nr:MAG: hypothetical protein ACD_58C00131G0018 [uncultured bacterium]